MPGEDKRGEDSEELGQAARGSELKRESTGEEQSQETGDSESETRREGGEISSEGSEAGEKHSEGSETGEKQSRLTGDPESSEESRENEDSGREEGEEEDREDEDGDEEEGGSEDNTRKEISPRRQSAGSQSSDEYEEDNEETRIRYEEEKRRMRDRIDVKVEEKRKELELEARKKEEEEEEARQKEKKKRKELRRKQELELKAVKKKKDEKAQQEGERRREEEAEKRKLEIEEEEELEAKREEEKEKELEIEGQKKDLEALAVERKIGFIRSLHSLEKDLVRRHIEVEREEILLRELELKKKKKKKARRKDLVESEEDLDEAPQVHLGNLLAKETREFKERMISLLDLDQDYGTDTVRRVVYLEQTQTPKANGEKVEHAGDTTVEGDYLTVDGIDRIVQEAKKYREKEEEEARQKDEQNKKRVEHGRGREFSTEKNRGKQHQEQDRAPIEDQAPIANGGKVGSPRGAGIGGKRKGESLEKKKPEKVETLQEHDGSAKKKASGVLKLIRDALKSSLAHWGSGVEARAKSARVVLQNSVVPELIASEKFSELELESGRAEKVMVKVNVRGRICLESSRLAAGHKEKSSINSKLSRDLADPILLGKIEEQLRRGDLVGLVREGSST